jgi:hypothetical protein
MRPKGNTGIDELTKNFKKNTQNIKICTYYIFLYTMHVCLQAQKDRIFSIN